MQKPRSIQLNIDNPCHEDWGKMTPEEQGRFCGSCQKTVIDFTTWSDADLFGFFAKPSTGNVCGRFFKTQLQKQLHIPPQPKSRLYRIAIACGLTLMFTQVPEVHAMVKHPTELFSMADDDGGGDGKEAVHTGSIRGTVKDKRGRPQQDVIVEVKINGNTKGSAVTDKNGRYVVRNLAPGKYEVSTIYVFSNTEIKTAQVTNQKQSIVNFSVDQIEPPVMGIVAEPILKGDVQVVDPAPPPQPREPMEKGKVKVR